MLSTNLFQLVLLILAAFTLSNATLLDKRAALEERNICQNPTTTITSTYNKRVLYTKTIITTDHVTSTYYKRVLYTKTIVSTDHVTSTYYRRVLYTKTIDETTTTTQTVTTSTGTTTTIAATSTITAPPTTVTSTEYDDITTTFTDYDCPAYSTVTETQDACASA